MFSNLTQGSTIYVLQTCDGIKYDVCTVDAVKPSFSYGFNNSAVVDIAVTIDGHRREFSGVQANSNISVSSNYVIADSKEAMTNQVQNLYNTKMTVLGNIEQTKKDSEDLKELLGKLSPQFAKEQALDTLTGRVDAMQGEFADMKVDVRRILDLLTNKN